MPRFFYNLFGKSYFDPALSATLQACLSTGFYPSTPKFDYIYPILENGLTPLEMDNRIRTFIRNTNKRLVKIGEELGLTMKMTSYVARHCFATIQKNNNAPLAYISEALGHSNLKTTQNYFGRFEDEGLKVFHSGLMEGLID